MVITKTASAVLYQRDATLPFSHLPRLSQFQPSVPVTISYGRALRLNLSQQQPAVCRSLLRGLDIKPGRSTAPAVSGMGMIDRIRIAFAAPLSTPQADVPHHEMASRAHLWKRIIQIPCQHGKFCSDRGA